MTDTQDVPAIRSRCVKHGGSHAMGSDCWLCKKVYHAAKFLEVDADPPFDDPQEPAIGLLAADVVLRAVRDYCHRQIGLATEADKRSGTWQESERMASRRSALEDVLSAFHIAMSEQCQTMGMIDKGRRAARNRRR